ncbi:hypothetical protein MSG28_003921 [Choristoneura fumiferana]|uniref:Uncharacterized protein n=1 Tax=Choristoneura fumiferana TaxID=7141 RepID=A0ACC0KGW3_CHOFU|nr:hypothetical protein MSG28_003921 [Choristoneura fumiferana]
MPIHPRFENAVVVKWFDLWPLKQRMDSNPGSRTTELFEIHVPRVLRRRKNIARKPTQTCEAIQWVFTARTLSDSSSMRSLTKDTQDILRIITNPPSCCTFDCQSKIMNKYHPGPGSSTTSRHSASSIADSKNSYSPRQRSGYKLTPASDRSKTTNKSRGSASTSRNSAASIDDIRPSTGSRNENEPKTPTKPNTVTSNLTAKQSVASIDDVRMTNRVKSGCVITAANCNAEIGYGKPLVTPVNKRLTIRRDIMQLSHVINPPVTLYIDVITKAVLLHLLFWRAAHVAACLGHRRWPIIAIIAAVVLFWIASKCAGNKLRASLTNPNVKADRPAVKNPGAANVQRPMSSSTRRANISPSKASVVSVAEENAIN